MNLTTEMNPGRLGNEWELFVTIQLNVLLGSKCDHEYWVISG